MLARRIISCLDVKDGRVVKGVHFVNLRDAGDPVEQARVYDQMGTDELVFLDIAASPEGRQTTAEMVRRVADEIFLPLTVGGGIRSVADMRLILLAGADKVSINTAAVLDPQLIRAGAERFGSQCVVLAIDARRSPQGYWEVYTHGGFCSPAWILTAPSPVTTSPSPAPWQSEYRCRSSPAAAQESWSILTKCSPKGKRMPPWLPHYSTMRN